MAIQIQDTRAPEEQTKGQARRQAVKAIREADEVLAELTDNWDGLTQTAKLQAVRRGVVIGLRVVKWLVSQG